MALDGGATAVRRLVYSSSQQPGCSFDWETPKGVVVVFSPPSEQVTVFRGVFQESTA